jgi:hypothetical protein
MGRVRVAGYVASLKKVRDGVGADILEGWTDDEPAQGCHGDQGLGVCPRDELVDPTGWNRDHARRALRQALELRTHPRHPPLYGPGVIEAQAVCWAVLRAPAGKRLTRVLPVLVPLQGRDRELVLTDEEAALLMRISAATIDRKLARERANLVLGAGSMSSQAGYESRGELLDEVLDLGFMRRRCRPRARPLAGWLREGNLRSSVAEALSPNRRSS